MTLPRERGGYAVFPTAPALRAEKRAPTYARRFFHKFLPKQQRLPGVRQPLLLSSKSFRIERLHIFCGLRALHESEASAAS